MHFDPRLELRRIEFGHSAKCHVTMRRRQRPKNLPKRASCWRCDQHVRSSASSSPSPLLVLLVAAFVSFFHGCPGAYTHSTPRDYSGRCQDAHLCAVQDETPALYGVGGVGEYTPIYATVLLSSSRLKRSLHQPRNCALPLPPAFVLSSFPEL